MRGHLRDRRRGRAAEPASTRCRRARTRGSCRTRRPTRTGSSAATSGATVVARQPARLPDHRPLRRERRRQELDPARRAAAPARGRGARERRDLGSPRLLPVVFSDWSLDDPLAALKDALAAAARALAPGARRRRACGRARRRARRVAERVGGPVLLVLDQFEEFFLYHDARRRRCARRGRGGAAAPQPRRALPALASARTRSRGSTASRATCRGCSTICCGSTTSTATRRARRSSSRSGAGTTSSPAPARRSSSSGARRGGARPGHRRAGSLGETRRRAGAARDGIVAPYLQLVLTRLWDEERRAGRRRASARVLRAADARPARRRRPDRADAPRRRARRAAGARPGRRRPGLPPPRHAVGDEDRASASPTSPTTRACRRSGSSRSSTQLAGDVRILRGAGEGRYEIYHDALAGPILDWHARWEERQRRRRERRRLAAVGGGRARPRRDRGALTVFAIRRATRSTRPLARARRRSGGRELATTRSGLQTPRRRRRLAHGRGLGALRAAIGPTGGSGRPRRNDRPVGGLQSRRAS